MGSLKEMTSASSPSSSAAHFRAYWRKTSTLCGWCQGVSRWNHTGWVKWCSVTTGLRPRAFIRSSRSR